MRPRPGIDREIRLAAAVLTALCVLAACTPPSQGDLPSSGGTAGTAQGGAIGSGGTMGGGGAIGSGGAAPTTGGTSGSGSGGPAGTGGASTGGGRIYYVTPTGRSSNDGESYATAVDFATAHAAVVPGDAISMQAGTYSIAYQPGAKNTLTFSKVGTAAKPILVYGDGGHAIFDFSFPEQQWVQDAVGFMVTGSYWTFRAIAITRAGYQGAYVTGQHNTFENCSFHDNRNTGLEINEGGAYTTVINCDAYRNYDPKKSGGMADGFAPKQTQGPGNRLVGCRAWENSDDGFDTFDSPENVVIENCWAFRNGVDVWNYGGFDGNGNGFKLGGNAAQANPTVTNSVAFDNRVKGFDQNNNRGGITVYNSTAYQNGTNFGLGGALNAGQKHDLKNNISVGSKSADAYGSNTTQTNNSWQSGLTAAASDFASVDTALAEGGRAPDGTLPPNNLFRLKSGSRLIDAGIDVGLPFKGSAPDLGAFEN